MEDFLSTHGLWTFAFMILVDELGLPLFPNGIALFTIATLAPTMPDVHIWHYALTAIFVTQLGQWLLFFGGQRGLRKWIGKYHFRIMPSEERLERIKLYLSKKRGFWTTICVCCVTTIRPYFSLIAGSTGMNGWKFFPFSLLGTLIFVGGLSAGGYFIGNSLLIFFNGNKLLLTGILIILFILWHFKSRLPWKYFNKKTLS